MRPSVFRICWSSPGSRPCSIRSTTKQRRSAASAPRSDFAPVLHLEVLQPNGRSRVVVDGGPYTIGRSSENRLQLADGQVSRVHAELREAPDGWHVRDCGSRFGTFLNDHKIADDV